MVKEYESFVQLARPRKRSAVLKERAIRSKQIYLMLIPIIVFFAVFSYAPMYGITLAWKSYKAKLGIMGSPSVGWKWFKMVFEQPQMLQALRNTLVISGLKLAFCFTAPILLALLINEVHNETFKKIIQWSIYLPYFINWVVIGGIVKQLLAYDDGLFNNILAALGKDRVLFTQIPEYFYTILISAELWKGVGWGTVIYMAGISAIDQSLYEAAKVDGCNRFKLVLHVTLPSILPLVTVMLIMQVGNIMNAGFDSVYNLYNPLVLNKAEILDTLVYTKTKTFTAEGYGYGTAVGLFKNVINFILLISANMWTKKINGYSMYSLD